MHFAEWLFLRETKERGTKDSTIPGSRWRYGNYCGPGPAIDRKTCDKLADGRPLPPAINVVDAACKDHDLEYCGCGADWRAGFLFGAGSPCSRGSDVRLMKTLDQLAKDGKLTTHDQWMAAHIIKNYFRLHNRLAGTRLAGTTNP